jgi:hypothetical protein
LDSDGFGVHDVRDLIAEGWQITGEDLGVLSPYLTAHIQRFGVYATDEVALTPDAYNAPRCRTGRAGGVAGRHRRRLNRALAATWGGPDEGAGRVGHVRAVFADVGVESLERVPVLIYREVGIDQRQDEPLRQNRIGRSGVGIVRRSRAAMVAEAQPSAAVVIEASRSSDIAVPRLSLRA